MRICSFVPSATEILYSLGLGDSIHGVSHECDFPPDALTKPKVVRSRFDTSKMSSKEIDAKVNGIMAEGKSIYEVDIEVLKKAKPDMLVTQELCDVCAVSFDEVRDAALSLDNPPQLVSLDPNSLDDVIGDIEKIGGYVGEIDRASEICSELKQRVALVRSRAAKSRNRPKVACIEWLDPLIVSGHWIPEMVALAGGANLLVGPGVPSRKIPMNMMMECDPEVLVFMPCGMDVNKGIKELALTTSRGMWAGTSAVKNGRVYMANGSAIFSRSGPRLVDGLDTLGQMIHPEVFKDEIPQDLARKIDPDFFSM